MASRVLALLVLLAASAPTGGVGQGAEVLAVLPEAGGRARAQLQVSDPAVARELASGASPDRLRARTTFGGARVAGLHRLSPDAERLATVLAFDQSGSFAPYWAEAFTLAGEVFPAAAGRQRGRLTRVVTFGLRSEATAPAAGEAALRAALAEVAQRKAAQKATRLKSSILDAARTASTDAPLAQGGLREVVVFTDAGEESDAYDVGELVRAARELGVQVHVVCFYARSPHQGRMAARMDQMRRLAEGTGGAFIQVDSAASARAQLERVAGLAESVYWADLAFCGLGGGAPAFENGLSLEVNSAAGSRVAWSEVVPFAQRAEGPALQPCDFSSANPPAAPQPGQPPAPTGPPGASGASGPSGVPGASGQPGQPEQPGPGGQPEPGASGQPGVSGQPGALQPTGAPAQPEAMPGSGSVPVPSLPVRGAEPARFPWWWLLLALLALAVLILLWRRRGQEEVVPVPAPVPPKEEVKPPAPPVVPVPAPEPAAPAWRDPFAPLPETRLVVVKGPPGLESFYRLNKQEFSVGGASGEVDLFLNVAQVSGKHAVFQLFPTGSVFVIDQRSTNGTFVDGRRLTPGERVQLKPGQTVGLSAQLELRLEQPGAQAAAPVGAAAPASAPAPAPAEPGRAKAHTIYAPMRDEEKK